MLTIFDRARMTPLEQWKQTHTENLLQPVSGLIRRGTESVTERQYARLAARDQLPGIFRIHAVTDIYEHRFLGHGACDHHVMVPLTQVNLSTKDIRRALIPEYRLPMAPPYDSHVHTLTNTLVETGKWLCGCGRARAANRGSMITTKGRLVLPMGLSICDA
jgi:hypothetical protein